MQMAAESWQVLSRLKTSSQRCHLPSLKKTSLGEGLRLENAADRWKTPCYVGVHSTVAQLIECLPQCLVVPVQGCFPLARINGQIYNPRVGSFAEDGPLSGASLIAKQK